MEMFRATLLPPPPDLLGHLTASDHLASSPSPFLLLLEGAAKSQVSGQECSGEVSWEARRPPPPGPPYTHSEAPLPYRIPVALLPVEHLPRSLKQPFPTCDPGTMGPKRWENKKVPVHCPQEMLRLASPLRELKAPTAKQSV